MIAAQQFDKEEHEFSQVSLNAQVSSPELVEKLQESEVDDDESRENQPHEHMKLENRVLSPNMSTVVEGKQQSAVVVGPVTPVTQPQWNSSTVVEKIDGFSQVSLNASQVASPVLVEKSQEPEVDDDEPLWMRGTSPMSRPMSTSKPNSGKGEGGGDFMGSNSSGSETEREEASFAKFVDVQVRASVGEENSSTGNDAWYKEMTDMMSASDTEYSSDDGGNVSGVGTEGNVVGVGGVGGNSTSQRPLRRPLQRPGMFDAAKVDDEVDEEKRGNVFAKPSVRKKKKKKYY